MRESKSDKMGVNLKKRAVHGVKWTSIYTFINVLSAPIYQVILASMLLPQDFAYIAVISLIIGLSELMSNMGIGEAVIQREKVTLKQLSTLFYLNLLISLLISVLFYTASPFIQNFYGYDNLELIVKLLGITIFINGLSSIFRVYLQRNLLFREFSIVQITKTLSDILITTILIFFGLGIMGYVFGTILSTLLSAFSLIFFTFRKTDLKILNHFNIKDAIPFINFGISISIKKILTFVSQRIDEIIIGANLSSENLGIYYFGKRLVLQIQTVITNSFAQVLLPVFSKIKNNIVSLKNAYTRVSYTVAMVAFPILVGITLTIHLIVPIAFGKQWTDSVIIIQILSLVMILQVLTANIATSALYSINKPGLVLIIDIVTNIIYITSLILFSKKGILFILFLFSAYIVLKTIILQYFVSKYLRHKLINYYFQFNKIALSTFTMVLFVLGSQYLFKENSDILQLFISIITGIIVYLLMQWILDRKNTIMFIESFVKKGKQ